MENNEQNGLTKDLEMVCDYKYLMHIIWLTLFEEKR
jgi:hypothetical protein